MTQTLTRPLFRIEAIDARRGRVWYGSTMRPPVSLAVFTVALFAAVLAIALFLGTQTYARKAEATGYLAPLHGVVRVLPPRPGVIVSVAVAEGDKVQAGDTLVRVETTRISAGGADIDANVRRALNEQRNLQRAQIAQEEGTEQSEEQRLAERINHLQEECQSLRLQFLVQHDRAALAAEQAMVSRELATKGYVSAVEQRRREDARLGQVQAGDTLSQQLSAKEGELIELRYTLAQLPGRTTDRLAALRVAVAETESKLAQAEGERAFLVVAPTSGRVSALQAIIGNQTDPTKPLLSIVPEGEALQAVLFVPERAIGFVAPGQDVRLLLEAFPSERFGVQHGMIATVSRTLLRPDQLNIPMPLPAEPTYRVTVTLLTQYLTAYGRTVPLQADMQLRAHIIFDRRSFAQWLLDPVLSTGLRQ